MSKVKTVNFMIDFETLGKAFNGQVLSVAYSSFILDSEDLSEPNVNEELKKVKDYYFDCSIQDYEKDLDMLEWWGNQDAKIVKMAFKGLGTGNTIDTFCTEFENYVYTVCREVNENGKLPVYVWARGTNFDITILERLFYDCNMEVPFKFYNTLDTRTFLSAYNLLINGKIKSSLLDNKPNAHDPRYDVAMEIAQVKEAFNGFVTTRNELLGEFSI